MTGALAPPGEPGPPQAGIQSQVLIRSGDGWRIASFQNTNSKPERPFQTPGGQPVAEPATRNQPAADYQSFTVPELESDGARLAAAGTKVSIAGAYILQDNRDMLYSNVQAIIKMKYSPNAQAQPAIPLLVHEASDHFRRMVLACQTDPSASKVGCNVKIRGKVTLCPVPDAAGESRQVPCVSVEDGK